MQRPADLPVLRMSGAPRERGRQHGEAVRPLIHAMDARWRADVARDLGMDPDDYARRLVEETEFLIVARERTPELLEEIEGLAEGAGLDFRAAFARQLCDEDWWVRLELKYGAAPAERCSSLGAVGQGTGAALVAQNMDTPAYWDDGQVLLHIHYPCDLEVYIFTVAGSLALCGMNNHGVGVCCNTILQCDHARHGLPEQFVVRSLLEQTSQEAAQRFLRSIPHASPQNYLIGDRRGVIDLEVSANQIARFVPPAGAGRVYHTNHPLVNDDQGQYRAFLDRLPPDMRAGLAAGSTTLDRLRLLESRWADTDGALTVEQAKAVLSTPPVCVAKDDRRITLGCAVMELAPVPRLHLAPGPPDGTDFQVYEFDRCFDA